MLRSWDIGSGAASSGHCPNPGKELTHAEWLDEVVVGAQFEGEDPLGLIPTRAHHDDRHRRVGADPPAHFRAVHVREPKVEQHEVGAGRLRQSRCARGCPPSGVAGPLQPLYERDGDGIVVLDDQQAHGPSMVDGTFRVVGPGQIFTWCWAGLAGRGHSVGEWPRPSRTDGRPTCRSPLRDDQPRPTRPGRWAWYSSPTR